MSEEDKGLFNISIPFSFHPWLLCSNVQYSILFAFSNKPATDRNLSPTRSVLRKEGEADRESEKLIIFVYLY